MTQGYRADFDPNDPRQVSQASSQGFMYALALAVKRFHQIPEPERTLDDFPRVLAPLLQNTGSPRPVQNTLDELLRLFEGVFAEMQRSS